MSVVLIFTASLLGLPFILYTILQALSLNTHHLKTKAFNSISILFYTIMIITSLKVSWI